MMPLKAPSDSYDYFQGLKVPMIHVAVSCSTPGGLPGRAREGGRGVQEETPREGQKGQGEAGRLPGRARGMQVREALRGAIKAYI